MRAQEFLSEYQKIHRGQSGGIELLFRDSGEHGCRVEASVDGRPLGSADFDRDENILVADKLEVDERYRGQGIAKTMYDYVKSLGYTIERSDNLTDAGRAFWRKNRGRRQVWEQESQDLFTEKINPETLEPGFVITRRMKNGYIIRARGKKRYSDMPDDIGIEVEIIDPNYHERYPVADARFKAKQDPDTGEWFLSSLSTGTLEKYRRQGLASAMYNFARALGNDLRASRIQSRAGEDFWKKGGAGQSRPLELEPEVDLVAEVKLLSRVKGKGADLSNLPRSGREIPQGRELQYLGRKQADLGDYEIWRDYLGGQVSYHLWNPTTRQTIITAFGSRYQSNPHSFIVGGLYAAPGNPIRAAEFYRALVLDLGLTLISDRKQSPGGQRVWQQLEKFPGIEVYGFDTRTGKVINIGAEDEEMYSVPSDAVAGSQEMARIARDIRLVATAK